MCIKFIQHRFLVGYAISLLVGHIALWLIVDKWMWTSLTRHHSGDVRFEHNRNVFTWAVGIVERTLYTTSFLIGAWQLVGIWLALKATVRWRKGAESPGTGSDNVWLIGSGVSLLIAFVGAWVAAGHVPCLK